MSDTPGFTLDMLTGTCRLVLAIAQLVDEARHETTLVKQELDRLRRESAPATPKNGCVNCGINLFARKYFFGPPGTPVWPEKPGRRNSVGPLCSRCRSLVLASGKLKAQVRAPLQEGT